MNKFILLVLFSSSSMLLASTELKTKTCVKCHPKIVKEYQDSAHKNASIYNDPIHKAIWDRHPMKKKGSYKCAKCHTPSDKALLKEGGLPTQNSAQLNEPVSCQTCHKIESIEKHAKANKNIYTKDEKTFFSADSARKGTKLLYQDKTTLFGLFKTRIGSPYHDIDYSNENYYDGGVCLGCHDHKQNGKEFMVCDMQIKEKEGYKENCITCHMPKIKGSFVNLHDSKTHRYHGRTALTANPKQLSKYIKLELVKESNNYAIMIENRANHTLASQPLRLSKLRIYLANGQDEKLIQETPFVRIIGTKDKPSAPWLATQTLKDTLIKAFEKRAISLPNTLKAGDEIVVKFGYHLVNPKIAKKLDLEDEKYVKFVVLSKKRFVLKP